MTTQKQGAAVEPEGAVIVSMEAYCNALSELEALREQVRELTKRVKGNEAKAQQLWEAGNQAIANYSRTERELTAALNASISEHKQEREFLSRRNTDLQHERDHLRDENEAARQALVTAEFMTGDTSDVLDVLGAFIEHHKGKEAENKALREALEWYKPRLELCNSYHKDGDVARDALATDRGKRADAALSGKQEG